MHNMNNSQNTGAEAKNRLFRNSHFLLSGTEGHILHAAETKDAYRIDIAIPDGTPPKAGWPSLLLLDAAECFGTCMEALHRMSRRPDATGVVPAVVIGISVPQGVAAGPRRRRDFTSKHGNQPDSDQQDSGGAPLFYRFIEEQVKPLVAQQTRLDPSRQTLFGHSLAGYFTLWTLANHPLAFRNYAAISPSIWWDSAGLLAALSATKVRDRRVLLCLGEWEDSLPPWQRAAPGSAEVMMRRRERKMLAHAQMLSERLKEVHGSERVRFQFLPEEDHASIVSAAIPRMLRMASGAWSAQAGPHAPLR